MSLAAWSWITAAATVIGVWLQGRSPRKGWLWGIGAQCVWIAAAALTGQPGTLVLSVVLIGLDIENLYRWRGTNFTPAAHQRHPGWTIRDRSKVSLYQPENKKEGSE